MRNSILLLAVLAIVLLQSCSTTHNRHHSSVYCNLCARSHDGSIHRDPAAKKEFMSSSGYPNGRPGYVVDHVVPLYKGGADTPENMQWLTKEQHKEKHRDL